MNVKELCEQYNQGKRLDYAFFWGSSAYLSNWHPTGFIIDGIQYWCTEQYMMAEKAKLFEDIEMFHKIMKSRDQKEIKAFGRRVSNFDENIWNENKEKIMYEGNLAKFSQNEHLKNYIISTKDRVLVEASPYDGIWGVGLKENDSKIKNPNNWKGQNLLGFTLMKVRDTIINNEKRKDEFLKDLKANI